jgi:Domain of unknown function (DUF1707)
MDPQMRASDTDRDSVATRLREAHAEGRLTMAEFEERLEAAYAARTLGELAPITLDLPALPAAGGTAAVLDRGDGRSPYRVAWGSWASAVFVCVAIWAATGLGSGGLTYFWPIWVAGPWGAVLLARTLFGDHRPPRERPGRRDGEIDHR